MADIRAFSPDDVTAVARLFNKVFLKAEVSSTKILEEYLYDLYFNDPWADPEIPSKVYIDDRNQIAGFIGIIPTKMTLNGRPIRAAASGSLMVERPHEDPLAGARLIRSFVTGPQQLSYSETANPISQRMWEKLGGQAITPYSMEWLKILKPLGLIMAAAGTKLSLLRSLLPLAKGADWLTTRSGDMFKISAPPAHIRDQEVDAATLAGFIRELMPEKGLHPDWEDAALLRRLNHATRKARRGPITQRLVRGCNDEPIGWYIYHTRPGDIAYVLDIGAKPGHADAVIDCLLTSANAQGCVAIKGRTQPNLVAPLLYRNCLFLHRSSTMFYTKDPELIASIASGDAVLNGLAAETWIRLIGDDLR